MNEIMFYVGLVLAWTFFLLAIFLFFYYKVPSVIKYFLKMGNKKLSQKELRREALIMKQSANLNGSTELLSRTDKTGLIEVAQNYATALLDADSTTMILPNLDEEL